jgi:Flp pilus assembly protein TadB
MLAAVVVAVVLVGMAAKVMAQEGEAPTPEQMERLKMGMELEAHKAELEHEQQMRQLDIEARRAEIERQQQASRPHGNRPPDGAHGGIMVLIIITNILLTVWVFKDMHEQKIGRALWVPIVLLTGVFGAILYAIVRLADTRCKSASPGA